MIAHRRLHIVIDFVRFFLYFVPDVLNALLKRFNSEYFSVLMIIFTNFFADYKKLCTFAPLNKIGLISSTSYCVRTMKKVFMSLAAVALMVAAVSCGNNNAKKAEVAAEEVAACCDSTKAACCDSTKACADSSACCGACCDSTKCE